MALIDWKEEFRTGIASVDYEHEQMIRLLNDLYSHVQANDPKDTILAFLGEVHARIAAHFALEERIMREKGYDQYLDHKADHEDLLDEIRKIMDSTEQDPGYAYGEDLSRELQAWFGNHFKTKDSRLHRMLG
jgi:hemerythrin